MPGPRLDAEQEVRFAVVMYGGVSLAIYINGIAQELLRLVRATAPTLPPPQAPPGPDHAWFATDQLKGTELVYRKVGQLLPNGTAGRAPPDGEEPPIRTRFVVDILSGTSAGGINAIFLAKAIANQQSIDPLRQLWIESGAIADLINDRASYKDLAGVAREQPPQSLLNSSRLFLEAQEALKSMEKTAEQGQDQFVPAYADEVNLSITTTDLQGLQLPLKLSDRVVYETRHRNVLRFGYSGPNATGEKRNEFTDEHDEILAFAARCTSAFPFAFSPAVVDSTPTGVADPREAWKSFFPDYATRDVKFDKFAFADGGYLDNKPFSYATDELRRRRADVPVTRTLLYIEPDPPGPPRSPDAPPPCNEPRDPPDAVDNVIASLNLARKETIREDIERVAERNETVKRIRRLTADLSTSILADYQDDEPDVGGRAADSGVAYTAYLRLRVEQVVDDLTAALVRLGGGRDDREDVEALRVRVSAALADEIGDDPLEFLVRHDVRFRLRRLAFVQDCVNHLIRDDPQPEVLERLKEIKLELNNRFVALRTSARLTRRASPGPSERDLPESERAPIEWMREAAETLRPGAEQVKEILEDRGAIETGETFRRRLLRVLDVASYQLQAPLAEADLAVRDYLRDEQPPGTRLDAYFTRFETFDMVMLPLTYPDLEEVNPVAIVRIAPEDATNLIDEGKVSPDRWKLAGTALAHFGGFVDKDWRRNDLMWGRLDGAERILQALLKDRPELDGLVDEAQAAIIREELVEQDGGQLTAQLRRSAAQRIPELADPLTRLEREKSEEAKLAAIAALHQVPPATLLDCVRNDFKRPKDTDPKDAMSVAGRAANVTSKILDAAAKKRSLPARPGFWLSRLGLLAWGVVELAVPAGRPATLPALVFRYWAQLALLLGVISILAGILLGVDAAQTVGWVIVGGTLLLLTLVWLTGALLSRPSDSEPDGLNRWWWVGLALLTAAIVALLIGAIDDSGDVRGAGWVLGAAALLTLLVALLNSPPDRRTLKRAAVIPAAGVAALAIGGATKVIPDIKDLFDIDATVDVKPMVEVKGPLLSLGGLDVHVSRTREPGAPLEVERLITDRAFKFGKPELTDFTEKQLKRLRHWLSQDRRLLGNVEIAGFADYVGTDARNLGLSAQRAHNVRKQLTGIHGHKVVFANGEAKALADQLNDKRRHYDRRVRVVVISWKRALR